MYYRRWTRMHLRPGIKYFMKYGVVSPKFDKYSYLLQMENPTPLQHVRHPLLKRNHDRDLDSKLISSLFLKYPDLQYEPISQNKVPGQSFNTFSYAYSFINEQKKLIRQGYSISKSFQLVEQKYHEKMQRTLDQSLLSRGLAFGNRARSFLNVYQQQAEFEARLKTQRTRRELDKYDAKLNSIRETVESGSEDLLDRDVLGFERIFYEVKEHNRSIDDNSTVTPVGYTEIPKSDCLQRTEFINSVQKKFKNLFQQFYQHAATKDRLEGLTDADIMSQIQSSPSKVKRQTRQLIKYLDSRNIKVTFQNGQISVQGAHSDIITSKIRNNNYLKMAFLSDSLNYEKPMHSAVENPTKTSEGVSQLFDRRKQLKDNRPDMLSKEDKATVQAAKKKELELVSNEGLDYNREVYKILETQEERMIRLEIRYYDMLISEIEAKKSIPTDDEGLKITEQLQDLEARKKQTIQEFRRLKYRLERRYRTVSAEELLFPEHEEMGKGVKFEQEVEYEELLGYLRRKNDDRRLTSLDQSKDSKINKTIRVLEVSEGAIAEGTEIAEQ